MTTSDYELGIPPSGERSRELWIQHAAGFIIFQDARQYAIDRIDPNLNEKERAIAQKGIDDAIYGLMMIIDGVSGRLENPEYLVELKTIVKLIQREKNGDEKTLQEIDLFEEGDGMCMGYHGWLKGDFGEDIVATQTKKTKG